MAGGGFMSIFRLAIYFTLVWYAGKVTKMSGMSPILAEIATGLLLGPEILGLLPTEYTHCDAKQEAELCPKVPWGTAVSLSSTEYYKYGESIAETVRRKYGAEKCGEFSNVLDESWRDNKGKDKADCYRLYCQKYFDGECQSKPNIFTLMGHFGVSLMIFESGMHFHFPTLHIVGPKGALIAVLGTLGPLGMGFLLTLLFKEMFADLKIQGEGTSSAAMTALTVGVAMAPTSVGIALALLTATKKLSTRFGQTIIAAAFLDDILSLIAFSLLFEINENGVSIIAFFPLIFGVLFLLIAGYMAAKSIPAFCEWLLITKLREEKEVTDNYIGNVHLTLMAGLLLFYAWLTNLFGSHLWGCFLAGMSFSSVPDSAVLWSNQTKRLNAWMMRIFFSCTVGFAIPVKTLLDGTNFGLGMILGVFACIGPKLVCALFDKDRWVIGWAMVGRAEFAYLIAEMGKSQRLIGDDLFAQLIWALLTATITAPAGFSYVLKRRVTTTADMLDVVAEHDDHHMQHLHSTEEDPRATNFQPREDEVAKAHMIQLENLGTDVTGDANASPATGDPSSIAGTGNEGLSYGTPRTGDEGSNPATFRRSQSHSVRSRSKDNESAVENSVSNILSAIPHQHSSMSFVIQGARRESGAVLSPAFTGVSMYKRSGTISLSQSNASAGPSGDAPVSL
ncbi:unnamed protein product [Amoebophrya sp. A25]|nr:unnamed protein product [Amoebophrya sp. A25]|eukprot:GSA25T00014688001.1